jgi:hypothetical protein
MRGGAIPLLVWALLLIVLAAINGIWTGDAVQGGTFAFAIVVIAGSAVVLVLRYPSALRRGPPEPRTDPEAIPDRSVGAVAAGLSIASILFGFVFGRFFILFGLGTLVLSLGRIAVELWAERRSEREAQERGS